MKALTYILGFILYINYRIIYAFFIHKRVNTFTDFAKSKADDNLIPVILIIDIGVLSLWFFGWLWTLIILTVVTLLNFVIFGIVKAIKK